MPSKEQQVLIKVCIMYMIWKKCIPQKQIYHSNIPSYLIFSHSLLINNEYLTCCTTNAKYLSSTGYVDGEESSIYELAIHKRDFQSTLIDTMNLANNTNQEKEIFS